MTVRIGQQLGEYRLVRALGKGSYAEVFLGEHLYLGTRAAIKVLHTSLINQEDNFIEEARKIAGLSHPNIVRVLNFAIDKRGQQPIPYLVMDFAPQGNILQRHPRGSQLTSQQILPYVKQIAGALDYAHDRGLVHRDVKPENILVGQDTSLLLSDFGIAVVIQKGSSEENSVPAVGTKAYIAPEQILGNPQPQSDQYALGIIVYEWLCGVPPFPVKGKPTTEILSAHLQNEPPPLRSTGLNVSMRVEQIMARVLVKDPRQRFATVSEFAQQLEQAFQETPISLTLPPPTTELSSLPNATTLGEISQQNLPPLGSNSLPTLAHWTDRGMLPPPMPAPTQSSAGRRQMPGFVSVTHPLAGRGQKQERSKPSPKIDMRYFYARKRGVFRTISLLLTIASAVLVSSTLQNKYLWIPCLLVALPLFGLCILFSNRRVTLLLAFLLACYWAIVGAILDATILHSSKFAGIGVVGIIFFCISLALYIWYALTKTP